MRSWFTFIVTVMLVLAVLILLFVVNFVLTNRVMFEARFDIVIPLQFIGWSHTWEGVQFMSIITGSILLGALIVAVTTLGLDTRRTLKLRGMRKEIKRLQAALEKAEALQAAPEPPEKEPIPAVEETAAFADSATVTPEDITKSFEDTIQKGAFLTEAEKPAVEEPDAEPIESASVTGEASNDIAEGEQSPIEAEVVERAEPFEKAADRKETSTPAEEEKKTEPLQE